MLFKVLTLILERVYPNDVSDICNAHRDTLFKICVLNIVLLSGTNFIFLL